MDHPHPIVAILTASLLLGACAPTQPRDPAPAATPAAGACLDAQQVKARDLYGEWRARFGGAGGGEARVTFEPHRESPGALSGRIVRSSAGRRDADSVLAGGIADGEFGIEESDDGQRISGLWNGSVVPGSCGREIRGTWIDPADDSERGFVLRQQPPPSPRRP